VLASAVAAGVLGLSACGSAGPKTTTARSATTAHATTASPTPATSTTAPAAGSATTQARSRLTKFLLAAGEEPGFPPDPSQGGSFSTLQGWVDFTLLTKADARLLQSEGFVAAAQENVGGANHDGASFVEEFRTPAGARREAANDASEAKQSAGPGSAVVFFSVPGLANAHGVLIGQAGGIGTDIYWTQGRCTLWLGNEASEPLKFQVEAGAKAINRRTRGTCP
jgi:hypothetical protein